VSSFLTAHQQQKGKNLEDMLCHFDTFDTVTLKFMSGVTQG